MLRTDTVLDVTLTQSQHNYNTRSPKNNISVRPVRSLAHRKVTTY